MRARSMAAIVISAIDVAAASLVEAIYERGVVLAMTSEAAERLPEPTANPATLEADPDDTAPDDLKDKLKRAWDYLSGNY